MQQSIQCVDFVLRMGSTHLYASVISKSISRPSFTAGRRSEKKKDVEIEGLYAHEEERYRNSYGKDGLRRRGKRAKIILKKNGERLR